MKKSKRQEAIEARIASDPIAQKVGRTDIDYTNPDELPTAPRMAVVSEPATVESLAPRMLVDAFPDDVTATMRGDEVVAIEHLPMYLECAMCGEPGSFVIHPFDPAVGYCFKEQQAWRITDLLDKRYQERSG